MHKLPAIATLLLFIHTAGAQQTKPVKTLGVSAGMGQTNFLEKAMELLH